MSVAAVTMQNRAAAARCGAKVAVWHAVHVHHGLRSMVAVDTPQAHVAGVITAIDDKGFIIAGTQKIPWGEALAVVQLSQDQRPEGR